VLQLDESVQLKGLPPLGHTQSSTAVEQALFTLDA
jgi:hypothetical protein